MKRRRWLFLVLILSITAGVLYWFYSSRINSQQPQTPQTANLNIWVLETDEKVIRGLTQGFKEVSPDSQITLVPQTLINYITRLEATIQSGKGPDIFRFPVSEFPVFVNLLSPAPADAITSAEFKTIFYPVASDLLVAGDQVYAVPESVDGLAMYVNTDILKAGGVEIPKTWEQFVNTVTKVTVKDSNGIIQTSGAALGTTKNVDYWPEIIELLYQQQPKANLASPDNSDSVEVIQFYTGFVTDPRKKTWDQTLPTSSQMFEEGRLAIYFGSSQKSSEFKAHNPNLNFVVAPPPQLSLNQKTAVGSFWVWGVSDRSANKAAAWKFLRYLSTTAGLEYANAIRKQNNLSLKPYPRVDMKESTKNLDSNFSTFVDIAPNIKTWYLNSDGVEGGINQKIVKIYEKVITDTLAGVAPQAALGAASPQIKQILSDYKVK